MLAPLSTGARNDLFLPEEFQWRASLQWFFFRNVGTLTALYRENYSCLLYTSPSPRDGLLSRMPSSA